LSKYPEELSGGMKQRVALARAIFSDRPVVFLDEPFPSLDPELKERIRGKIADFCRGRTLILVSHDAEDVLALTDRTIALD
jgi:ABC-type nitrate/sulfonate/bicarbonate transport system ATPase subunit